MLPLSVDLPKTLLEVQGNPLLHYVIEGLVTCGIKHLVVVIGQGELFTPIISYLQKIDKNIKVDVITQTEVGVRGAILAAEQEFEDEKQFFLAHGDIIAPSEFYVHLKHAVERIRADGGIICTLKSSIGDFGVCILDENGYIEKIIEQPSQELKEDLGNYIGAGAYIFPTSFFKALKQSKTFDEAINTLIKKDIRLSGAIWSYENRWMDIGTPYDLLTANKIIFLQDSGTQIHSSAKVSPKALLIGSVNIEAGAVIDHGAVLKGPVYIGRNVYIGTNCLIRDYTVIEEGCVIGFSVELKNTHLQPYSRVGRLSFIGDSVIGRSTDIRSGVTILNNLPSEEPDFIIRGTNFGKKIGVIIGAQAEIGANAVLEPKSVVNSKQKIPPGTVFSSEKVN